MLIKNLPKPIKELVFKRHEELELTYGKPLKNFNFWETTECAEFWRETNKANYKPFFEKYGGVILCTSVEQGAKIIEYFKSMGVDTGNSRGTLIGNYYGIYKNRFTTTSLEFCFKNSVPIFTLDELGVQTTQELGWQGENTKHIQVTQGEKNTTVTFSLPTQPQQPELPEINFEEGSVEMLVWDNNDNPDDACKMKIIAKINGRYLSKNYDFWDNARPIEKP